MLVTIVTIVVTALVTTVVTALVTTVVNALAKKATSQMSDRLAGRVRVVVRWCRRRWWWPARLHAYHLQILREGITIRPGNTYRMCDGRPALSGHVSRRDLSQKYHRGGASAISVDRG